MALFAVALLTLSAVGSITPAKPVVHGPVAPAFVGDIPDGELVRLLALREGIPAHHAAPLVVPAGATLPGVALKLAKRAGIPEGPEAFARFATLDPRVSGPVLTLLVAVDQAWDLTDRAFAKLTPQQKERLSELAREGKLQDPEYLQLEAQVDKAALLDGAILLLDTLEGVVIPALKTAADSDAWPATGVWDPGVAAINDGVLRLGSTGNDVESMDRIVQIDPRGDDTYYNNAGGSWIGGFLHPLHPNYPVAVSLDLSGNDRYDQIRESSQGGGEGIGILEDLQGNDTYSCDEYCQGGSADGVGFLRDYSGDDQYHSGGFSQGFGSPLGLMREDEGNDSYSVGPASGGAAWGDRSIGVLWDRAGTDTHYGLTPDDWGVAETGGFGWYVDEGSAPDTYTTQSGPLHLQCNNCSWRNGYGAPNAETGQYEGIGYDNEGSLGDLLARSYLN